MTGWFYFWTLSFIVAGAAFAFITVVVLVLGIRDLREMFSRLKNRQPPTDPPQAPDAP